MDYVYGDSNYTSNSISISRVFQENFSAACGVTNYGKVANFIGTYIEQVDRMAESLGAYFSKVNIDKQYTEQYGKPNIVGKIKRNFTPSNSAWENQINRRDKGFITGLAVESGIKLFSRGIQMWTSNKEKFNCFSQIYRILLAYSKEGNQGVDNSNLQLQIRELNKIRNSFPISANDRLKLSDISVDNFDVFTSDFTIFDLKDSDKIKENIAYYLYVLYAQKYGESVENESRLLQYYRLMGFHEMESKELLRENKEAYDIVTDDQLKYLILSRKMLKNLETSMPHIDIKQMARRIDEMSKNDPYRIRKRMVLKPTVSSKKTILDIFFNEPDVVLQAGSAAVSQLVMNDGSKEEIRNSFVNKWGLDHDMYSNILSEANDIQKESNEVEQCF